MNFLLNDYTIFNVVNFRSRFFEMFRGGHSNIDLSLSNIKLLTLDNNIIRRWAQSVISVVDCNITTWRKRPFMRTILNVSWKVIIINQIACVG